MGGRLSVPFLRKARRDLELKLQLGLVFVSGEATAQFSIPTVRAHSHERRASLAKYHIFVFEGTWRYSRANLGYSRDSHSLHPISFFRIPPFHSNITLVTNGAHPPCPFFHAVTAPHPRLPHHNHNPRLPSKSCKRRHLKLSSVRSGKLPILSNAPCST
jgi:hypothetical protein